MGIWIDNANVVRGLEKRLGIERADAVWAVAENWSADSHEVESSWRVLEDPCNWVWVLMVACGEQWTCCWNECKAGWRCTG